MKVDNFVSNRLKNYICYISVTTRPSQVCILGYAPKNLGTITRSLEAKTLCILIIIVSLCSAHLIWL